MRGCDADVPADPLSVLSVVHGHPQIVAVSVGRSHCTGAAVAACEGGGSGWAAGCRRREHQAQRF